MTADEFSTAIRILAPTVDQLRARGLTAAEIEVRQKQYSCSRLSHSVEDDPIIDLCTNFDISTLEIGSVKFCRLEQFDPRIWQIGRDELDPIIYPKGGGWISTRDHEQLDRQLVVLAKSSGGFLGALACAAKFLVRCPFNPELRSEGVERFNVLNECVLLAGGEECRRFYVSLLGIEDQTFLRRLFSRF